MHPVSNYGCWFEPVSITWIKHLSLVKEESNVHLGVDIILFVI